MYIYIYSSYKHIFLITNRQSEAMLCGLASATCRCRLQIQSYARPKQKHIYIYTKRSTLQHFNDRFIDNNNKGYMDLIYTLSVPIRPDIIYSYICIYRYRHTYTDAVPVTISNTRAVYEYVQGECERFQLDTVCRVSSFQIR